MRASVLSISCGVNKLRWLLSFHAYEHDHDTEVAKYRTSQFISRGVNPFIDKLLELFGLNNNSERFV